MSHAAAYGRLAGGTAEKVHNSDVRVPRQACCILDPKRTRWCVIREGKSKVFYETYGSGSKHIVLVMGLAAVHMQWEPQIQYFGLDRSDQYTVAVFDGRGIGFSEDCGGRWRTTDLAQDVIAIVNQLGWSEGCHLVGFSLGGMISLEALLARPDIFDSLALISSHAGGLLAVVPPLRGWLPFMKTFACLGLTLTSILSRVRFHNDVACLTFTQILSNSEPSHARTIRMCRLRWSLGRRTRAALPSRVAGYQHWPGAC